MMKRFLTTLAAIATSMCVCSCATVNKHMFEQADKDSTAALCVGVERGKYGSCPGAEIDAKRMHDLLKKKYAGTATLLLSQQATKAAVVAKMREVCKKDLAIIFYSGHGGDQKQSAATKQNFIEPTGKDQFLCLYDGPMLDDEIWSVICGAKGRVVLIFDCCHSGTMYRAPITFEAQLVAKGAFGAGKTPRMLCISGCPDNAYSYGGADGGILTTALLGAVKDDRTYERVWKILHNDSWLNKQEQVQFSETGDSFKDFIVFR